MKNKAFILLLLSLVMVISLSIPAFGEIASESTPSTYAEASGGIFSGITDIYQAVKNIFVPREDYFHNKISELNEIAQDRFGGLAYLYLMLDSFFKTLNSSTPAGLSVSLPDNYFFYGYHGFSFNLLHSAAPYINFLKSVLNAVCCLFTAIACYHKLRTFFTE